jgi:hypothetical protein
LSSDTLPNKKNQQPKKLSAAIFACLACSGFVIFATDDHAYYMSYAIAAASVVTIASMSVLGVPLQDGCM